MQKVKNWIIRTFGLKGSFQWALRQMKKWESVMRANAPAAVIFRSGVPYVGEPQPYIFSESPTERWRCAAFTFDDFEATDWIVVTNKDEKPPKPDNR